MKPVIDFIVGAPFVIQFVTGVLAFLVVFFVARFVLPAVFILFRLRGVVPRLRRLKRTEQRDPTPIFALGKTLTHLWNEYQDTLHEQREFDPAAGAFKPTVLRSTVPAAMIFTTESLVDSRLATGFSNICPGCSPASVSSVTFRGLIQGLQAFKVSDDAGVVRTSLEGLMHHVSDAFLVSATAIFAAMVATLVEKMLVAALYRKAEELTFELDSMFESGAGEEYLARLVKASEDWPTKARC